MKEKMANRLFRLFLAGVAIGILAAFFLRGCFLDEYDAMQEELFRVLQEKLYSTVALFMFLFWRRGKQVLFAFAMLMTSMGVPFLYVMAGLSGLAGGAYLFAACCRYGISGTLVFLGSFFPQLLCYLPLCYLLVKWGIGKKISAGRFFLGILCFLLGCFAEACFNPPLLYGILRLTV